MSARRRRTQREPHPGPLQIAANEPSDLWTTDYKGQLPTRNGWWCASRGLKGLTKLSVWWLELGIRRPSPRRYPAYVPEPEYPNYFQIFPVHSQGTLHIDGELNYRSSPLADERIGMEEADGGVWNIYFCKERLARYDERTRTIGR